MIPMPMDDPFIRFDLPRRFAIDRQELRRRFLAESAKHHPDRYTDPLDQADAAQRSAEINLAYQTLLDDEQRANVLLSLLGGPDRDQDKSLPPELLMEMMEIRQEMEQAIDQKDQATLHRLHGWAIDQRQQRLTTISRILDAQPAFGEPAGASQLKQARLELNALRYIQRMLQDFPAHFS